MDIFNSTYTCNHDRFTHIWGLLHTLLVVLNKITNNICTRFIKIRVAISYLSLQTVFPAKQQKHKVGVSRKTKNIFYKTTIYINCQNASLSKGFLILKYVFKAL